MSQCERSLRANGLCAKRPVSLEFSSEVFCQVGYVWCCSDRNGLTVTQNVEGLLN